MFTKLILNKYTAFLVAIILIIVVSWYSLYKWHYGPIKRMEELITTAGTEINRLEVDLDLCKAESEVISFESFFEGGAGVKMDNSNRNIFLK